MNIRIIYNGVTNHDHLWTLINPFCHKKQRDKNKKNLANKPQPNIHICGLSYFKEASFANKTTQTIDIKKIE